MMPYRLAFVVLAFIGSGTHAGLADDIRELDADLTFWFDCAQEINEASVERFLKNQNFDVLNVARTRRERGMGPTLSSLFIDGIDQDKRMIRVTSAPFNPATYNVTLNTRPPTERSTNLEADLLDYAAKALKCHVRQIRRSSNGPERRAFYDDVFKVREQSFIMARDWQSPRL